MFYILVVIFGFIEFLFGAYISFFSKENFIKSTVTFIYDEKEVANDKIKAMRKWLGQCFALEGSFYAFAAAICKSYELGIGMFLLFILIIEIISFKSLKRGIIKIFQS